jgi:hypothetical protein
MKKLIFLIAISYISFKSIAQTNSFPATGNVGIANGTSAAVEKLDVSGNILLRNNNNLGGAGASLSFSSYSYDSYGPKIRSFLDFASGTNSVSRLILSSYSSGYKDEMTLMNGKVGVSTINPQSVLHISGAGSTLDNPATYNGIQGLIVEAKTGGRSLNSGAELEFVIPANTDGTNLWGQGRIATVANNTNSGDATGKMVIGTRRMFAKNGAPSNWFYGDDIVIDGFGNVGIGTLNPAEKLSVKGKIRAQEIKVESANWADFVFGKNYKLPPLAETEEHIKKNGHLPGIPSAAEVAKNGIELGDMNKKLLQKIEELTLYLIEMKKGSDLQQDQIKKLSGQIEALQTNQKR